MGKIFGEILSLTWNLGLDSETIGDAGTRKVLPNWPPWTKQNCHQKSSQFPLLPGKIERLLSTENK